MNKAQAATFRRFPNLSIRSGTARLLTLAKRDTSVVVGSVIATNFLRALSSVILTRLLVPEVFGIAGLIAAVSFTLAMMSDLGFQAFVVRHEDGDKPRFLDTVWTVSLLRSLLLAALLVVLAVPIAGLFGKPELAPLIAISSLTFVIEGLASLTLLSAIRNRMVLKLTLIELAAMIVQIAVAAIMAYFWRNYWAILIGILASGGLKTLLSYVLFDGSRRRLAFDRTYLRDLWGFARFVTGSSIITLILLQCDKLILGKMMSLDEFGLYILAGNLATAPLAFAGAYASRVLYPAYAELWRASGADLRARFYRLRFLPSALYTFAAGGLIGSAPLLVALLYDPRYNGATPYLQLLCIMPLLALASNAANEALTATGRIRVTLEASIVKLVWLLIAAPGGYFFGGVMGLVAAIACIELPAMLFKWYRMYRAGLLELGQEMLFLSFGGVGAALATMLSAMIMAYFPDL